MGARIAARQTPVRPALAGASRWPVLPAGPCLHPGEDGAVAPCANHLRHAIVRSGKAATGHDLGGRTTMVTAGEHFARALAAKDSAALCALLADPVDFQALTPGRHWQATTGRQGGGELIFQHWVAAGAPTLELGSVPPG